jgi:L-seryl-tRNA(Ser) seleniumtransferase
MVERIRKNPFARMFRTDKATNIALEVTLESYINGTFREEVPLYRMLSLSLDTLRARAENILAACSDLNGLTLNIGEDVAYVGGGALPEEKVVSIVVSVGSKKGKKNFAERASFALRTGLPSIICRVHNEQLVFDLRSVFEAELPHLSAGIRLIAD